MQFTVRITHDHPTQDLYNIILYMYMKKAVMVGPDKPAIPGRCCFELVGSHQQGIFLFTDIKKIIKVFLTKGSIAVL